MFFSGWKGEDVVEPDAVRAAATVELIHLATLVHDDILDDAALRHASPTLFAKYGAHTAVLLGDAIFAHALKLMSDFDDVELCRALAVATRKICTGEIWLTTERGNAALSLEGYFEIIQMKTGELFEVSALLGASLAGRGADAGAAFARFGRHIGRAYQIFDDIVDYLGTESAIGKTLGTDLSSGKFTLPEILFFRGLDAREREAFLAEAAAGTLALGDVSERMRAAGVFGESREFSEGNAACRGRARALRGNAGHGAFARAGGFRRRAGPENFLTRENRFPKRKKARPRGKESRGNVFFQLIFL